MTSTPEAPRPPTADPARVRSLDGLRGVAALVVVVHHALQLDPAFARVQGDLSADGEAAWVWALTHTPLHVLWAGEEAVLVFFVLSGFVLALPATRHAIRWSGYYPRRLVRLYLPVWGSLLLAVALKGAIDRPARVESPWLGERSDVPLQEVWHDAALLDGTGFLNSPLWSLRWEVVFSIALPAYLLAFRRRSAQRTGWDALGVMALIGIGTLASAPAIRYLPVFALGVLLAHNQDRLAAATARLDAHRFARALWALTAVAVASLLTARWLVAGLPVRHPVLDAAASAATIAGAAAAVVLALRWTPCARGLDRGATQWLGARSFSLYLVHEPVVVAAALLLPPAWGAWPAAAVGVVLALAVSALFYVTVERPSITLSRRAGRWPRASGVRRDATLRIGRFGEDEAGRAPRGARPDRGADAA